jgi:nicotinamidase-related amidase
VVIDTVAVMSDALLVIDAQNDMLLPPEPIPAAESVRAAIDSVLDEARKNGTIIVFVRNNGGDDDPDKPGTDGWQLVHDVRDGEHVVDKHVPNSFTDTGLAELLPAGATVTIVGMQSEWCVLETSLEALRRGHPVRVVSGAHGTYDGEVPAAETAAQVEKEIADAGGLIVRPTA